MGAATSSYIESHRQSLLEGLQQFLRIPSISTLSEHQPDIRRAADFVASDLSRAGLDDVHLIEGEGNPLVSGSWLKAPGQPTLLLYGHYDVQPPDPLDEWIAPPFEPTVRNGNIYARGATDDKGQMLTHVKGAEAWIKSGSKLPVQLKFLIEGEEEVGSANLEPFVAQFRDRLACSCVVISDC